MSRMGVDADDRTPAVAADGPAADGPAADGDPGAGTARLNLGCGDDYREGWHNVDVAASVAPDEVVDLAERPWPWPDDAWTHVRAEHVLEHLDPVPWDELTRVLAPGGRLELVYPIGHTRFEDPSHAGFWNYHTAEALVGDRAHGHQFVAGLTLVSREVEWDLSIRSRLLRLWVRWHLFRDGPGPWLSQVPGLYGEVRAEYVPASPERTRDDGSDGPTTGGDG
ncbi:class I SAM-dependent methyltransferase [Halobaculum lipolyticum]|uniref:Class I SAM-dependent methyltransferase n=1 Tax=Halobaculum lipolyticum TaxID=3032001 RepID=A0ABD5WDL4_9EURY|nr:hypothetical protein [Halobaculum sp. DT31]